MRRRNKYKKLNPKKKKGKRLKKKVGGGKFNYFVLVQSIFHIKYGS